MVRIGITGHSALTAVSVPLVVEAFREVLGGQEDITGVTCLARGADQLFARAVLDLGGTIEVVLPSADYRERKVKPAELTEFDELVGKAADVYTMPFAEAGRDAYMAASEHVLSIVDELVAVWDGAPASGRGGTSDVVEAAHARGMKVTAIWPGGCARA
ncbi:MAG: hypothetical protein QOI21_4292 [Actinomycetota bacterium]|nr:hypothetical protein [Actinomycetota bacterium]